MTESAWGRARERIGAAVHVLHGTRSLLAAVGLLLFFSIVEPLLPAAFPFAISTFIVFVLAVLGLATLPREGVAVQVRLRRLAHDAHPARALARHVAFPLALVLLLLPDIFLAAYGIPHFSPLTGLLTPPWIQRIAATFLFLLLLLPVMHLRRTRAYAPDILPRRPKDLDEADRTHQQRDLLLVLTAAVAIIWLALLWQFWRPFSLFAWTPSLSSLAAGVTGVARVSYAVFLPILLFILMAAHAQAVRYMIVHAEWRKRRGAFALLWVHLSLLMSAAVLHLYDLMWIVRYQAASLF